MKIIRVLLAASAALFYVCAASAQQAGTVTQYAFAIGKGAGSSSFVSLLCGSAQLAVGQSAAAPICRTLTGDVTLTAAGVTAIGTAKVITAMINANAVTNAKLAQMANNTAKCRTTAGTGDPEDCTGAQMRALMGVVIGTNVEAWDADLDCIAALSGTGILRRTGAGTCSNGTLVTNSELATAGAATLKGNPGSSTAGVTDFTIQGLTNLALPDATNDRVLIYDSATGLLKNTSPGAIAASSVAGVSSVNNQTGIVQLDPGSITNCTLLASVSGNALTVALKTQAGANPSAGSPCAIAFRDTALTTGGYTVVPVTAATSFSTGTSGSTFGSSNATAFRLWITAINNAGTVVLGVSNQSDTSGVRPLVEDNLISTTACSACTTAATVGTVYSTAAQATKPMRIIGYLDWGSGLTTAGTWASVPTKSVMMGPGIRRPGESIQMIQGSTSTQTVNSSTTFAITGATATITPTSSANLISVSLSGPMSVQGNTAFAKVRVYSASGGSAACTTALDQTQIVYTTTGGASVSNVGIMFWTAPNTASSITYTGCIAGSGSLSANFPYISGQGTSANIMLMEIMGALPEPVNDNINLGVMSATG